MAILFLVAALSLLSSVIFQVHVGTVPTAYQVFDISFYHFIPFFLWVLCLPLIHWISRQWPLNPTKFWLQHLVTSVLFAFASRILAIWVDFAIKHAVGMTDAAPLSVLWDVRWVVLASLPKALLVYWLIMFLFSYFEKKVSARSIDKLALDTDGGTILLSPKELLCIESSRNYIIVHTSTKRYRSRKTLKSVSSQLGEQFMQIHRSRIVNTEAVVRVIPWRSGEYMLELQNGLHVSSSRSFQGNVRIICQGDATRPATA
ncbi:MAG: LytTR family DNA-binding domain-containing protein [Cytophagales bacterium]|nr:LytTR family DNA-binding domain-containing protein [Cytophagales bacterium]